MGMAVRHGAGPIIIQVYEAGKNPELPAYVLMTTASWTFNPNIVLTDLMGPHGNPVAVVATSIAPTLVLSHMESPPALIAGMLHGDNTHTGEVAGTTRRAIFAMQTGEDAKSLTDLQTALDALALNADAKLGLYEIDAEIEAGGTGAGTIRRIQPSPAKLAVTDLFTVFDSDAVLSLFGAAPQAGSTVKVYVAIEGPIKEAEKIDFTDTKVLLHRILCFSGPEGNVATYLSIEAAVVMEGSLGNTRAEVTTPEVTYKVLGDQVEMTVVEFQERLTAIPGVA